MKRKYWTFIGSAVGMLILILDTKTAISGAQEGIQLCLSVAIPSLMPFFFLSILLTDSLTGTSPRYLRFISRLLRIPKGCESIFLIGALGGYPTGAICIAKAYDDGLLRRRDAERMLGFCSNVGPAFLFGITLGAFSMVAAPWALWGIHLIGAITAAVFIPGSSSVTVSLGAKRSKSLSSALSQSIWILGKVCGWIVLFRILIAFCSRWFLWYFDAPIQVLFSGLLELTNGCVSLKSIPCEGLRFILCSGILAFGGLCVTMQTLSAVGTLGLGRYIPGKLIQSCVSILLSALFQQLIFSDGDKLTLSPVFYLTLTAIIGLLMFVMKINEKKCSNSIPIGV